MHAPWQIRAAQRIAMELNRRNDSEVLIKFRRSDRGEIFMQIMDGAAEEMLRGPRPGTAVLDTSPDPAL